MALLECLNVTKRFFGFTALDNVSLQINKGELVGLIGPNGSGKTTLFNCITGFLSPENGDIVFNGKKITGWAPFKIALSGITRTFQIVRLFREMSVIDNTIMALQQYQSESVFKSVFRFPSARKKESVARERALELLEFLGLTHLKDEKAKNLSYGQQKLLSLAMALMPKPSILLLDEPAAYVNPTLTNKIKKYIKMLNQQGQTIFLIEHNMNVVMDLCERIIVLSAGQKIAEGTPAEIKDNPRVIDAYFGETK